MVDIAIQPPSSGVPSQSGSTRSSCYSSNAVSDNYIFNPFGFSGKTSFDATRELTKTRSENFKINPPQKDDDIWKRPPPDFRLQCFAPKPPKRNSREAMQPWKYGTMPGHKTQKRDKEKVFLPNIMQPTSSENERIITQFHIMDADEARMVYSKYGMNDPGPYNDPLLHEYRKVK